MTDPKTTLNPDSSDESLPPENDLTVDLSLEEFGDGDDLQALAAEMENYDPDADKPGTRPAASASAPASADAEGDLAKALGRIEALEKAEAEHLDKHHRLLADFANHRNRVGRDTQLAVTLAERKLLLEILPVLDSFERCVNATYKSVEDFHNGVVLISRQMQEALRKAGVEPLEVNVGDPFDAQHAEALTTTTQRALPDGSVAAIYERGYMLRDQLLRPARVIVNNNPGGDSMQDPS